MSASPFTILALLLITMDKCSAKLGPPTTCIEGTSSDVHKPPSSAQLEECIPTDEAACFAIYVRSADGRDRLKYECTNVRECAEIPAGELCYFRPGATNMSKEVAYLCCCTNGSNCNRFNPYHLYLDWVKQKLSGKEPDEVIDRYHRMNSSEVEKERRKERVTFPLPTAPPKSNRDADVLDDQLQSTVASSAHAAVRYNPITISALVIGWELFTL